MNWTSVVMDIILFAFVTIVTFVGKKYVLPWIELNHLTAAATVAVQAAETIYGRYHGDEKLLAALEQLAQQGFDIDSEKVLNAVKAAWQALDISQHAAFIKIDDELQNVQELYEQDE